MYTVASGPAFDWQHVDHKLANLMLAEISEQMREIIRKDEAQIRAHNLEKKNVISVPFQKLEMQLRRTDEWAQRTYDVYRDVWQRQGKSLSPEFLRAVCSHALAALIGTRTGTVISQLELEARRTNLYPTEWVKASTAEFRRNMERLFAKWQRRVEIEAKTAEHGRVSSNSSTDASATTTAQTSLDREPIEKVPYSSRTESLHPRAQVASHATHVGMQGGKQEMLSPGLAALGHRLTSVRALTQLLETDSAIATPTEKADLELMISFYKSIEQNVANEIELYRLTHGEIESRRQACTHPERYVSKAPPPVTDIFDKRPRRPVPSREELIAWKKAELESQLRKAEARKVELEGAITDWYSRAFPEWEKTTADARTRQAKKSQRTIEQYAALQSRLEQWPSFLNQRTLTAAERGKEAETQTENWAAASLPLKYRSAIKRAILIQLTQRPDATDLEICRGLDADGAVELPKTWKGRSQSRSFVEAYADVQRRNRIAIAISKVRKDLRKRGLLSSR